MGFAPEWLVLVPCMTVDPTDPEHRVGDRLAEVGRVLVALRDQLV